MERNPKKQPGTEYYIYSLHGVVGKMVKRNTSLNK